MSNVIPMYTYEFYTMIGGLVLGFIFFLLFIVCMMKTPAKAYLGAFLKKGCVVRLVNRSGGVDYIVGKRPSKGVIKTNDAGTIRQTEDSQLLETRGKVMEFTAFSEFSASVPNWFPVVLQSIKDLGFNLETWKDYDHILKLITNEAYRIKYLDSLKGDQKEEETERIQKLIDMDLDIVPRVTLNQKALVNKFPYNFSPVFIEEETTAAELKAKKDMLKNINIIPWAMTAFILAIIAVILYTTIGNKCPSVQCSYEIPKTLISSAVTNMTGVSMG